MLWRDSKAHFIADFLISGYDWRYKLLRPSKITIFDIVIKTVRTIHGVKLELGLMQCAFQWRADVQ